MDVRVTPERDSHKIEDNMGHVITERHICVALMLYITVKPSDCMQELEPT